jgi:hypothetical protein
MIMIYNDNDNHKTTIYTNNHNDNNNDYIFVSFAVPAVSSAVVPFLQQAFGPWFKRVTEVLQTKLGT